MNKNIEFVVNEVKGQYSPEHLEHVENKVKYINAVIETSKIEQINEYNKRDLLLAIAKEYINKMFISIEIQAVYNVDEKAKVKAKIFSLSRGEYIQEKLIDYKSFVYC